MKFHMAFIQIWGIYNAKRVHLHLADSTTCLVCKRNDETLKHIFQDCPLTAKSWRTWPCTMDPSFFSFPLSYWIRINVCFNVVVECDLEWNAIFSTMLWRKIHRRTSDRLSLANVIPITKKSPAIFKACLVPHERELRLSLEKSRRPCLLKSILLMLD